MKRLAGREGSAGVLDPVVITQDDQTELHVQIMMPGNRQQIDIRVWRRGPSGFTPSRNALTLDDADLEALQDGIKELLRLSNGGQETARVVWDQDEGRRLRAETEPFGTRFLVRLGFWQRTRNTWRPVDDGVVVLAESLGPLQEALSKLGPALESPEATVSAPAEVTMTEVPYRWPMPGADWLTVESDRLAFHPRGLRIAGTVTDDDGIHRLRLQQWQQQQGLWLSPDSSLSLQVPDLDALLVTLRHFDDGAHDPVEIATTDGPLLKVSLHNSAPAPALQVERKDGEEKLESLLSLPPEYLPRFGRMLAQAGMLLITHLSQDERMDLQDRKGPEIAPEIVAEALISPVDSSSDPSISEADEETGGDEVVASEAGHVDEPPREPAPAEAITRITPLREIRLGRHAILLCLREDEERSLALQWEGHTLDVPLDRVDDMLNDLRTLYYDALRGRRGQASAIGGTDLGLHMSVHHRGAAGQVLIEREQDDRVIRLAIPVADVPEFLDIVSALSREL